MLIGVDYFESNSRSEGTNSIQLSQDGSAYEVSFTASELAHEVELRKEYNSKLNNAIGDTVSVRNEPQANVVVVDNDGYNEVSIGPHTVDLPDKRNASFDKDNSTSGDISQSKTDSKAWCHSSQPPKHTRHKPWCMPAACSQQGCSAGHSTAVHSSSRKGTQTASIGVMNATAQQRIDH